MRVRRKGSRRVRAVQVALVALGAAGALWAAGASASTSSKAAGCNVSIAVISPMTGTFASYGNTAMQAAKLRLGEFSKKYRKCKVKLVPFDDQGDPKQAPGIARKVISDKNIVAVLGPSFSGVSEATDPIFDAAGMPVVTGVSTNSTLAGHGWKVFHRTVVDDASEGPTEAWYLTKKLHFTKIAVVDNGQTYGKGLGDLVRAKLKALGADIVDSESLDPNGSDYSSTVNKINGTGAQAVFCGCLDPEAARLVKQLRAAQSTVVFTGGAGVHTNQFLTEGGSAAEGAQVGSAGADATATKAGRAWLKKWVKTYKAQPDLYGLEWYNAATAILNAIGAGKTSRAAINTHISKSKFVGPSGAVAFQKNGNVKNGKLNWYKVKGGKFVLVDTVPVRK